MLQRWLKLVVLAFPWPATVVLVEHPLQPWVDTMLVCCLAPRALMSFRLVLVSRHMPHPMPACDIEAEPDLSA